MKISMVLARSTFVFLCFAGSASAQMSQIPRPECAPQAKAFASTQLLMFRRIRELAKTEGAKVCEQLESANVLGVDKLVDPKLLKQFLTPEMRDLLDALGVDLDKVDMGKLMRLLGIDASKLDLRELKNQCSKSKEGAEQYLVSEIKRLEKQLSLCDDSI